MSKTTAGRVPPLSPDLFTEDQKIIAGAHAQFNFARVMVQHPDLYRVYIPFAEKLMRHSILSPREREILILRTLELCDETYDAPHHRLIAIQAGLTNADIDAAIAGRGKCLSSNEQLLVKAAEELVTDQAISDETWRLLAQYYSRQQLMEIVFLVGNYTMMAMATKSFGITAEEGVDHG